MGERYLFVFDGDPEHVQVRLRDIQSVVRNTQMMTVAYVTTPVKTWSEMKEFFSEYGTALSDYLFDELERAVENEKYYRKRADVSLKVSDELKTENALLRQRIESLERKLKQAEAD